MGWTAHQPLREQFERITKRRGRKVAKVAVARQILTPSYYGDRTPFMGPPAVRAGGW